MFFWRHSLHSGCAKIFGQGNPSHEGRTQTPKFLCFMGGGLCLHQGMVFTINKSRWSAYEYRSSEYRSLAVPRVRYVLESFWMEKNV